MQVESWLKGDEAAYYGTICQHIDENRILKIKNKKNTTILNKKKKFK